MNKLIFKSRNGEFDEDNAPDALLKWYTKQENPSVKRQRDAAIEILKAREISGITVGDSRSETKKSDRPTQASQGIVLDTPSNMSIEPFVSNQADYLNKQLALVSQNCHLITPTTIVSELPPGFSAQVTFVQINTAEDCVPIEGALMLSSATLKRVNTAAGISWNLEHTKRTDSGAERHYWSYRAVGRYIDIDGNYRELSGEYEFDMRDDSARVEQIWAKATSSAREDANDEYGKIPNSPSTPEAADELWNRIYEQCLGRRNAAAKRDIDGQRKNGLTRAETGAKSRVTSELLKRTERGRNAWSKPIACLRLIKTQDPVASMRTMYPQATTVVDATFEGNKENEPENID